MHSIPKRFWLAASVSAAVLGLGGAASAQSQPGYYIAGEGGVSLLPNLQTKSAGITGHDHFDTGYAYGGAVGYDFGNGTRVELDSLHQQSNLTGISGVPANGHLQSTSLIVNGQYDLMQSGPVTPYVGVGVGAQNVGLGLNGAHDSDWKPAYQAEAGLRTNISDKVSLFGEYRFSQSEAANLSLGGVDTHQHFSDHGILAGLTYHMGD
ncbi:MAG TPA: outer membrane beta-barrel protein [Rhizomicrobium sp.]|nr:outer membrane beta-barrel protein [Rhizomicrobium sp.]